MKSVGIDVGNPLLSSILRVAVLPLYVVSTVRPTPISIGHTNHNVIILQMNNFEPLEMFVILFSTVVNIDVIIIAAFFVLSIVAGIPFVIVVVGGTPDAIKIFVLPIVTFCDLIVAMREKKGT